jgi:hypothetical protein
MTFESGRLVIKNLTEGCMVIVCTPSINVPLLNLTANVVARKVQEQMKTRLIEAVEKEVQKVPPVLAPGAAPEDAERAALGPRTVEDEARLIVTAARDKKILMRTMGEAAVRIHCPHAEQILPRLPEQDQILELAARGNQVRQLDGLFADLGFVANRRFNTLYGSERLRYAHPDTRLFVEVFLDRIVSYHTLDLEARLHIDEFTVTPADLLLSQLLNVEAGERDFRRIFALLHDHDLGGPGQPDVIDTTVITDLCSEDWGWYKTATLNTDKSMESASAFSSGDALEIFDRRAGRLRQMIEEAPKSLRWQMRARVGESRRWYEVPD